MKLSKFFLTSAITVLAALGASTTFAQAYKLRVMVDPELINPTITYVDFGTAAIGSVPKATTTFTNQAKTALAVKAGTFVASGNAALVSNTCGSAVQPGASCTLTSSLTVGVAGAIAGKITINTGASAGPDTVELAATGVVAAPLLVGTPGTLNFGTVPVKAPATQSLTITNNGNVTSKVLGLVIGANATIFSVNSANCQNVYLAPGDSCTVPVTFTPLSASLVTSTISVSIENPVSSSKPPIKTNAASLTGTGVTALPEFVAPAVSPFGALPLAGAPVEYTFGLQNSGKAALVIKRLMIQSANPAMQVVDNGTCEIDSVLQPGTSCSFTVQASVNDLLARTENLYLEYALNGSNLAVATKTKAISVRAGVSQLIAEPYSLEFIDAPLGQTTVQTLTLTNYGTIPVNIQGIVPSTNLVLSSDCGASLAAKASCLVNVSLTPSVLGDITEDVKITSDSLLNLNGQAVTGPFVQTIEVRGNVKDTSTFDISASSLNFGGVLVGTSSQRNLSVLNISPDPLTIATVTLNGAAGYSASHNCTDVPAGETCTVSVVFAPAAVGPVLNSLTVSDSQITHRTVAITGTGLAPELKVSSTGLDFGSLAVGATGTQTLTVSNVGTYNSALSWTLPANFSQVGGTCSTQLDIANSCTLVIEFAPTEELTYTGNLALQGSAGASQAVQLSGKGFVPVVIYNPSFSVSDENINFETVPVGTSSAKNVTVQNTGDIALNNFSATTAGSSFSGAAACPNPLPIGASCPVTVTFLPTSEAAFPGTLTLGFDAVSTKVVTLSGMGGLPRIQYESATGTALNNLNFGPLEVGSSSNPQVVVVRNAGTSPLIFSATPFSSSTGFVINANSCASKTLAVNQTCSITAAFSPTEAKVYNGQTAPQVNQPSAPALTLRGLTGAPAISFESAVGAAISSIDFSVVPANTVSTERFVVVRNTGSTALVMPNTPVSVTGPFAITSNTCATATVAPTQTCSFGVTFSPVAAQAYSGTLTLSSNAPAHSPFTLSGTGGAAELVFQTSTGSTLPNLTFSAISGSTSTAQVAFVKNIGNANAIFNATAANASAPFSVTTTTCTGGTLTPGQSCSVSVVFSPVASQAYTGALSLQSSVAGAPTLPLQGTGSDAPTKLVQTEVVCPATAYTGGTVSCTLKVTSTGNSAASLTSWGLSAVQGSARPTVTAATATCTGGATLANLLPGQSCSSTVSLTMGGSSDYVLTVAPVSSTSTIAAVTKTITVAQASLSLVTQNHPATQVGVPTTATHTLTNTGIGPITISGALSSNPSISVSSAACTTLAPGASCNLVTTCSAGAPAALTSTISVNSAPIAAASGTVSCTVSSPSASVAYEPGQTTTAGGFTTSGNWLRVSNPGVGAITLKTYVPAVGWKLTMPTNVPDVCKVNGVLNSGQSCLVLETIAGTQGPGVTVTGRQLITSSAGDLSWASTPISTKGIVIAPVTPFANVQVGDVATATYSLTNQAPVPASSLVITGTSGLTAPSNTCGGSIAPGATCQVTLQYTVSSIPGSFNGSVSVTATYPSFVSGSAQIGGGTAGVQGTLPIAFNYVAGNVSLTAGTNTPINVGASTNITHTLTNNGVGPVRLRSPVATLTGNTQHSLTATGTCVANAMLPAGQSCTIVTKFSPTAVAQTAATLTVTTSVGTLSTSVMGRVIPTTDVSVGLTGISAMAIGGAGTYNLTVANTIGGPARVVVTLSGVNSANGSAYLSGFSGGVCGTATLNSSGTVTASAPGTGGFVGAPVTCTQRLSSSQIELVIPANTSYSATLTYTAGASLGQVTVTAAGTITEVLDTNAANNQASVVSLMSLPAAELSIATTANPVTVPFGGSSILTSTIRNNSTGAAAAVGTTAQLSFSQTSMTGGAGFASLSPITCGAMSPGATCAPSGAIYLPAGGYVTVTNSVVVNMSAGQVKFTGTVTGTNQSVGDTNALNNTSNTTITVSAMDVEKRCKFIGVHTGANLGVTGVNGENGWPTVTPFSTLGGMGAGDWLQYELFDGWTSRTANGYTAMYLDPTIAKFKGTNISPNLFTFNGNKFIGVKIRPIAEINVNGHWLEDSVNYSPIGKVAPANLVGAVLQITGDGVLPVNNLQVWRPVQGINYVSQGAGTSAYTYTKGKTFRQVWIETSPGVNCNAAGTTFADYP